jgi:hypothetical protein
VADTGLRVATQAFTHTSGQTVSKGEVRTSSDALVTALPGFWTVLDNADPDIPKGKYAWVRQRG